MKQIAYIIVAMFLFGVVDAQTKQKTKTDVAKPKQTLEETMNWIVEKLNANSIDEVQVISTDDPKIKAYWRYSYSNFSFDSQNQSLKYIKKSNLTSSFDNTNDNHLYDISIPISKIYKTEYSDGFVNSNSKEGAKNTYLSISTYGKDVSTISAKDNSSDLNTSTSIAIDFTREPNMLQRFKKAFENLKSYFPQKKEAF